MTNENIEIQAKFFSDFIQAQSELPSFVKDTKGFGYKYMTLDQLLGVARPIFNKHNIAIRHEAETEINDDGMVTLRVRTVMFHSSGYKHESPWREMPVVQTYNDKGKATMTLTQCIGSAETYARRYSLQSELGVCAEEDDDGRSGGVYEPKPYQNKGYRAPAKQAPQPQPNPEPKKFDEIGFQMVGEKVAQQGIKALTEWKATLNDEQMSYLKRSGDFVTKLVNIATTVDSKK